MATGTEHIGGLLDREGVTFAGIYGAVVTVACSFVPFSPIAGGAVAAVRYDRGYLGGIGVGTLAGVLAAIPLGVLFLPALLIANSFGFGVDPGAPGYDLFLAIVAVLFLLYTVGLSALGGPIGVATDRHTDLPVDPARWL